MAFILPFTHKGISYPNGYWTVRPNLDEVSYNGIEVTLKTYRVAKKHLNIGEDFLQDYRLVVPLNSQAFTDYFSEEAVKPAGRSPKQNAYDFIKTYDGSYVPPTDSNSLTTELNIFSPVASFNFSESIGSFSQNDIDNLSINGYITIPLNLLVYNEDAGIYMIFNGTSFVPQ